MQNEPIQIMLYSEKSFVAFGNATKEHKELLKEKGGGYNRNLKDGEEERFSGWIFPLKKKEILLKALEEANIPYEDLNVEENTEKNG